MAKLLHQRLLYIHYHFQNNKQRLFLPNQTVCFELIDKLTGEITTIVVFVAVLPYLQYIYAEGMVSICETQWIEVNNHALAYLGGVPTIVVCDNCKQAVTVNKDWIDPYSGHVENINERVNLFRRIGIVCTI